MPPPERPSRRAQPWIEDGSAIDEATWADALSAADESYTHQIVAPRLLSQRLDPTWAERTYLSARLAPDLMFDAGRAVYPYKGLSKAFVSVSTAGAQHSVLAREPFKPGDDPDSPRVGSVQIEVVEPLEVLRVTHREADCPFELDLTFTARGPIVPSDRNVIEVRGEVVTDYMNFYQSGIYEGTIRIDGRELTVAPVAGFRDRGWGMRKHEGAPRRGFVLFATFEFRDRAVWLLLYESASGRRHFTNGWLVDRAGIVDTVTEIEHRLTVEDRALRDGELELTFQSGARRTIAFAVDARVFLSGGGYTPRADWPDLGYSRYDLTDPDVVALLDGQTDHGCVCSMDGETGHGFVETGFGAHPLYGPPR